MRLHFELLKITPVLFIFLGRGVEKSMCFEPFLDGITSKIFKKYPDIDERGEYILYIYILYYIRIG